MIGDLQPLSSSSASLCLCHYQVWLMQRFGRLKFKREHFLLKAFYYVCFYAAMPPGFCLCCIYCQSPCHSAFTACGGELVGVYEFIKAHDASSCFYTFRCGTALSFLFAPQYHTPSSHFPDIPAHSFNLVKVLKLGRSWAVTCHRNL